MSFRWNSLTLCYEFDTGVILGGIEPYNNYHGVCGLMHRDEKFNIVRVKKAFLNAEYYLRPGSGQRMYPRQISLARETTHEVSDDSVSIHFPPEPEFGFSMALVYKAHDDMVDMKMAILPSKDIPKFDIFFASYVCEALNETWIPLKNQDGTEEWVKLDNRKVMNRCFGAVRDAGVRENLSDGRLNRSLTERLDEEVEDRVFSKPILVARNADSGFTLIFLLDPLVTTYLTGQYHGWDTAHDWCFGSDLVAGEEMIAHTRMIYRHFPDNGSMVQGIDKLWSSFKMEARR